MDKKKIIANIGIKRNKKPLQNIIYWFELITDNTTSNELLYSMSWQYEKNFNINKSIKNWHGVVNKGFIKNKLSDKQWQKFCQGETKFIVQRKIDGKNI